MRKRVFIFVAVSMVLAGPSQALAQTPLAALKPLLGTWELSNAEHDKTCIVTLKDEKVALGLKLEFAKDCGTALEFSTAISAWTLDARESVMLLDAKGDVLLELGEVENALYEGQRADGLYFLQKPSEARELPPVEHFPDN
jgi:hypothetical protein